VGTYCGDKVPISGATTNPFRHSADTNYTSYLVELTTIGGKVLSTQAVVGVKPQAVNDSGSTREDTPLTVGVARHLANDTKALSRTLTPVNVVQPAHGSVSVQANGGYTYTPAANYFGPDSFTYQASDGSLTSAVATVSLTVTATADTPTVTPATTGLGMQTTNGLVISATLPTGRMVTHFKITNIVNGTLFQNNGTTPIANNEFITFAQGNAGFALHAHSGNCQSGEHLWVQRSGCDQWHGDRVGRHRRHGGRDSEREHGLGRRSERGPIGLRVELPDDRRAERRATHHSHGALSRRRAGRR
jgi:VCBS repeat-containing protein